MSLVSLNGLSSLWGLSFLGSVSFNTCHTGHIPLIDVVLQKEYRGNVGGKTSKTAVLPSFFKIELSCGHAVRRPVMVGLPG